MHLKTFSFVSVCVLAVCEAALAGSRESVPSPTEDSDWVVPFKQADLLYLNGGRPDFEKLNPIENCTGGKNRTHGTDNDNCTALWWPGLGNGFVGGIAQAPTLRIAGYYSGDYGRYTAGRTIPPIPSDGFSNKELAYRARIPAFASSIILGNDLTVVPGSTRTALNIRQAIYYERSNLFGGGKVELKTYFHRKERNLIVVEVVLDCRSCSADVSLPVRAFSGEKSHDVLFRTKDDGLVGKVPRQMIGVLRAKEVNAPSTEHLMDTNYTLGYVHDICPGQIMAEAGKISTLQLLTVLVVSSETEKVASKEEVVGAAMDVYKRAKSKDPSLLFSEHSGSWANLWRSGGVELETNDFELKQTTNSTMYYLLMSTRADWLHSTLTPSSIAASAPYPHGYYGTTFWDQDTFQAPPLMVFYPDIAHNLLKNRLFQLPAYRVNAKAFGLEGAYVPWETAFTGGFARDNRINHIEIHVSADVSLFAKQFYQLTKNDTALMEIYPLLESISDFVVSRINKTDGQGWYSIETVEGSDEKPKDCNNDIFTNAAGIQALETSLNAAAKLGIKLSEKQRSSWEAAASKIKLGFMKDSNGQLIHREYDQYTLGTIIGQGDTVLLGFPLQFDASHRIWKGNKKAVRQADIQYYGTVVDPDGSYMTAGHYVIAWLERPHRDEKMASEWFRKGREKNYAPWRLWSEHDKNDGGAVNFITAGGMFLQSLVFGYAGLHLSDKGVSVDPVLPPGVQSMKLRGINFADEEFDLSIDEMGVQFQRRLNSQNVMLKRDNSGVYWLTH